jgi:protein-tyrosine-phosphatase
MTKKANLNVYKGASNIAIVCIDNTRLSPVAVVIMRNMASKSSNKFVKQIAFDAAGYKRSSMNVSDSAKGYLQRKGFHATAFMEAKRADKTFLKMKDIIFTIDRFIARDLLYDFFPTKTPEWKQKILVLNDAAGIKDKIRDPGEDYNADIDAVFELIEKCCKAIIKKLEMSNK